MGKAAATDVRDLQRLLEDGLELTSGAALLLDAHLRVRVASPSACTVLGYDAPVGASAAKLLCGDATKRPVAEALAAGRPVQALVPRAPDAGLPFLSIRAEPLLRNGQRSGWVVLLEQAGAAAAGGPVLFHGMWTQDLRMKEMFRVIERVAQDDVTVLVRGETGTGKELVAEAIHALSSRRKGPFRAINCAALPGNLLESELFGHARGAFTGAHRDMPGHVQLAHRGTLFLDEVAELPLELQAKLLRMLETHTVVPVGAREPIPVDVRVVSATHRALRKEVEAGRFRADLMYRLRVIPLFLPTLRERRGDVALLCDKLTEQMNPTTRRHVSRVSPAALRVLDRHGWPGNVRELKNVLAYAYAIGDGPVLKADDLPPELLDPALGALEQASTLSTAAPVDYQAPEAQRILAVLERVAGNRDRAAQILGVSRVTLWRHMRELGIAPTRTPRRRAV